MSRRTAVYCETFKHMNPVPAACRIGNLVFSGGIHGRDPETGATPERLEEQLRLTFANVDAVVRSAGGSVEDIIKMTFWMADRSQRKALNVEWERMFPDPSSRPARHVIKGGLDPYMQVQCDFIAVLGN